MKSRTAAAGVRIMKTSSAETESGTIDLWYSRDGAGVDPGAPLGNDLARPRYDRMRLYLAQSGTESCRGRAGFVGQINYRPFDEDCFAFVDDGNSSLSSDRHQLTFAGETSTVWFIQDGAIRKHNELSALGGDISVVAESFQQRNTVMVVMSDMNNGMTLSIERMQHYEGIGQTSTYGLA